MSAGNSFQASGAAVENDLDPKAVRERGMSKWPRPFGSNRFHVCDFLYVGNNFCSKTHHLATIVTDRQIDNRQTDATL